MCTTPCENCIGFYTFCKAHRDNEDCFKPITEDSRKKLLLNTEMKSLDREYLENLKIK